MQCHCDFYLAARPIQREIYISFCFFFSKRNSAFISGANTEWQCDWQEIDVICNNARREWRRMLREPLRRDQRRRYGAGTRCEMEQRAILISLAHLSFPVVRALDTRLSALSRGLLFLAGSSLSSNGIIKPRPAVYSYRIASRIGPASIMSRGTGTIHVRADISLLL